MTKPGDHPEALPWSPNQIELSGTAWIEKKELKPRLISNIEPKDGN